jgi:hypothetical protein
MAGLLIVAFMEDQIGNDRILFPCRFLPAVTLGFGLLYKKLNRYEKGLEHVSRGLDYLDRGLAVDSCSWPGLPLQPLVSQYAFPASA